MTEKSVLLKPFRGETDPDRNFDILRSVILTKKLASKGELSSKQRANLINYCRTNIKTINELKKKYPVINDEQVALIAEENDVRFFFWTQQTTRHKLKLVTQIGRTGLDINLKISGYETVNQISYRKLILLLSLDNEGPYNSQNKRLKNFTSISHAVNHFLGTKYTEEEFFELWGDYEIRFRHEETFNKTFGIGFSIWSDDGKFTRYRDSWTTPHIPILMKPDRYRKLKFTIYEPFTAVIDDKILKDFRCPHCSHSFKRKWVRDKHAKTCLNGTTYKCHEKQYGGDIKAIRELLIDEGTIPEDDDSYKNFCSFDIESLSLPECLSFLISVLNRMSVT